MNGKCAISADYHKVAYGKMPFFKPFFEAFSSHVSACFHSKTHANDRKKQCRNGGGNTIFLVIVTIERLIYPPDDNNNNNRGMYITL